MQDVNEVVLVGRLVRDAELKYTSAGTAVSKFSIAVNRSRKKGDTWEEEAHFFDTVLWGRQAEAVVKYLTKGQQVVIKGELRLNRWTDKETGQNRSKVEINADTVQLVGGKKNADAGGNSGGFGNQSGDKSYKDEYGGPEDFEDDIPF